MWLETRWRGRCDRVRPGAKDARWGGSRRIAPWKKAVLGGVERLGEGISDHEVGGAVDKTDGPLAGDLLAEPVAAGEQQPLTFELTTPLREQKKSFRA